MVCAFLMLVGQWLVLGFEDRPMKADPQELIDRIRKDPYLNRDEKSQLIDSLRKTKHYGLVWEKKPEEVEENQRNRIPVLTEVRERAIVSEAADAPNHILIEGDNLDALVALTYTHEGKIDVIYIDPPYNTGNKDFIYNDKFVDSEDSFRHSKWLSFMDRRLRIAKQLLSDKGVIFISIDDNEQAQLKLLCDEIYGSDNYISSIPWHSRQSLQNDTDISINHEYILVVAKNRRQSNRRLKKANASVWYEQNGFVFYPMSVAAEKYSNPDNDPRGPWKADPMDAPNVRPNLTYPILNPQTGIQYLPPRGRHWRISPEKFASALADNRILFGKNGTSKPQLKVFLNEQSEFGSIAHSWFDAEQYGTATHGSKELQSIFGGDKVFTSPKPTSLIYNILTLVSIPSNPIIILDFFAGSGTTLHATMALNAEDGGHRQCILVTNNENRICEEVTYVRNKKVIEGYVNAKGETVKGLTANSLRYYRTDSIDREKTAQNRRALAEASVDLICIRENAYNELNHFGSLKLKPSVARYFTGNGKHILLILNENAIEYFVKEIKDSDSYAKFKVYVFSPGDYAYDDEFTDVADRVELCAVPSSVYNAYEKVLPKRVRDVDEEESDDFAENGGDGFLGDARNFEDQGEEKPGQNENDVEE